MTSTDIRALIDANAHRLSPLLYRKLLELYEAFAQAEAQLRIVSAELAEVRKELDQA